MPLTKPKDRTIYPDLGVTAHARLWGVTRQRADQILNLEKHQARVAVHQALASGKLVRPTVCERCNRHRKAIEAHHGDYTNRLKVQWLCRQCHGIIHPHGPPITRIYRPCPGCSGPIDQNGSNPLCRDCIVKAGTRTLVCTNCGNEFYLTATVYYQRMKGRRSMGIRHNRIFCGHRCASLHWRQRQRESLG